MNIPIPSHGAAVRTCRAAAEGSPDALQALQDTLKYGKPVNNADHEALRVINKFLSTGKAP